jgi:hypothetical protein
MKIDLKHDIEKVKEKIENESILQYYPKDGREGCAPP